MSYTTSAYSNPRLSAQTFKDVDGLAVMVDVTNIGSRADKEKEFTIREWLANPKRNIVFGSTDEQVSTKSRTAFGGNDHDEGALGVDIMNMFMDLPLVSVLMFQQNAWSQPADEIVDDLLKEAHAINC